MAVNEFCLISALTSLAYLLCYLCSPHLSRNLLERAKGCSPCLLCWCKVMHLGLGMVLRALIVSSQSLIRSYNHLNISVVPTGLVKSIEIKTCTGWTVEFLQLIFLCFGFRSPLLTNCWISLQFCVSSTNVSFFFFLDQSWCCKSGGFQSLSF